MIASRDSAAEGTGVLKDFLFMHRQKHATALFACVYVCCCFKQICQRSRRQQSGKSSYPASIQEMTWAGPSAGEVCIRGKRQSVCVCSKEQKGLDEGLPLMLMCYS